MPSLFAYGKNRFCHDAAHIVWIYLSLGWSRCFVELSNFVELSTLLATYFIMQSRTALHKIIDLFES